ncbi:hypothetical protein FSARC_9117 [Fusarium sarcochroum]|uniref:Uncharacterized protein n=1 Tax=Fusarium sarcochroum TaxID=1208366 RepID=A0A8H4TS27_9HYPO|nr:hypothetical protein FSARC_9117 [Fusarium sarcochroum]
MTRAKQAARKRYRQAQNRGSQAPQAPQAHQAPQAFQSVPATSHENYHSRPRGFTLQQIGGPTGPRFQQSRVQNSVQLQGLDPQRNYLPRAPETNHAHQQPTAFHNSQHQLQQGAHTFHNDTRIQSNRDLQRMAAFQGSNVQRNHVLPSSASQQVDILAAPSMQNAHTNTAAPYETGFDLQHQMDFGDGFTEFMETEFTLDGQMDPGTIQDGTHQSVHPTLCQYEIRHSPPDDNHDDGLGQEEMRDVEQKLRDLEQKFDRKFESLESRLEEKGRNECHLVPIQDTSIAYSWYRQRPS